MAVVQNSLLIIDDNSLSLQAIVKFLNDEGYKTYQSSTGAEALANFYQLHPDVIICDIKVLEADDAAVFTALGELVSLTPLIVISSENDVDHVVEALRFGASDYLQKPITDMSLLKTSVERCLDSGRLRHQHYSYRQQLEDANLELKNSLALLRQDQKAGRQVQFKMLPDPPKAFGDYEFTHRIFPSLYLSGDFIDYFMVGDEHAVFFIADVSGHGASSAFVTVLLKNLFARKRSDFIHHNDQSVLSTLKMLKLANEEILDTDVGKHLTMCMGVLHLPSGKLNYSNAGHLPQPILTVNGESRFMAGEGMPVGLFEEPEFNEESILLPENFVLTLFSDGILEILPVEGLQAQEAFLLNKLQGAQLSVAALAEGLEIQHITEFPDDIATLLISKNS